MQQATLKILEHYDMLLNLGQQVIASGNPPPPNVMALDYVDPLLGNRWFTRALSLISRTIGEDSAHYRAMQGHYTHPLSFVRVNEAYGVLLAAKDDIQNDALFSTKALITAEVFDDILEQGKALLDAGYFAPAAVVIGCVLEDGLRRLCGISGVVITDKAKLDGMNSELVKAGAYSKLTQKKITALADIRNSAAHGKWDEFDKNDVEDMLRWTRNFIENSFS